MTPARVSAGDVTLRAWRPEEAGVYLRGRDVDVYRFTTEEADLDEESCRTNIVSAAADPHQAPFAICDAEDNPVGNLAVRRIGDRAEISYWLAPGARGRGWASRALRAATSWALGEWDVDHVDLEIDPANGPSIRVAEAAGYRRHGTRLESSCGGPALLFRHDRDRSRQATGA